MTVAVLITNVDESPGRGVLKGGMVVCILVRDRLEPWRVVSARIDVWRSHIDQDPGWWSADSRCSRPLIIGGR